MATGGSQTVVREGESDLPRTIVITGAGAGLGRALARRFASGGDTVLLLGRTLAKVEQVAAEIGGHAFACDVASPESVRAAFATVGERFPRIDVLINNAAVFEPFMIAEATDAQIMHTTAINLCGPMLCVRSALPLLGAGGHIVNVSSESVALPFPHLLVYQATKAGIERFSEGLERELAADRIRVTCVRAGQMMDADSTALAITPEVAMRFAQAAMANGLNLRERPISQYASVAEAFVAVVDMPADIHMGLVTLSARKPDA
jgi:meso-butanediol dehydrogenase/(S,S)-butanediol dehydrogenase/diacetyl reductase